MTAPVDNGVPSRKTEEYTYGDEKIPLRVHQVTEESQGEVTTVTGTRRVAPGEYLIATERPDVWEVRSEDAFNELGASKGSGDDGSDVTDIDDILSDDDDDDSDDDSESERFDPSAHNASEVKAYLARPDVSEEEKARVRSAERDGQNRQSALR